MHDNIRDHMAIAIADQINDDLAELIKLTPGLNIWSQWGYIYVHVKDSPQLTVIFWPDCANFSVSSSGRNVSSFLYVDPGFPDNLINSIKDHVYAAAKSS